MNAKTKMNKIHLSAEQKEKLETYKTIFTKRPTGKEYETFHNFLLLVKVESKPKIKKIPNVLAGHGPGELKLKENFDALKDLPEGWAVVSVHDSGGNHVLCNAAEAAWRDIWNAWTP